MYYYSNVFAELAARVRRGDEDAQERLREELEDALVVMVRQTLRRGRDVSSIGRRILATARRLREEGGVATGDADDFVREVAHSVCDEVVARLQPGQGGLAEGDTMTCAQHGGTLLAR